MTVKDFNVVCWKYAGDRAAHFTSSRVNEIAESFRKFLFPHNFICITDNNVGLDARIEALPMPSELPDTYRRLWLFGNEAAELIGGRILSTDIDAIIIGDLCELFDREEDAVFWHDPLVRFVKYSGGTYMFDAGSRSHVWEDFSIATSPREAKMTRRKQGLRSAGRDQVWMSYALGEDEAVFAPGIYRAKFLQTVPKDARIIHFPGTPKHWNSGAKRAYPWLEKLRPHAGQDCEGADHA